MSIEYTIDIQLTELGFPDILQQRDTSARDQTPCRSTSPADSPSPSPPKAPTSTKQRRQVRGQQSPDGADTKQPTEVSASPLSEKLTCKPRSPVRSLQAAKDPAPPDLPEATVTEEKDTPLIINEQEQEEVKEADGRDGETLEEMEEDSDDSDVSGVYEEEEVEEEEDDEDEEGVNNESAHPGDYCCTVCDLHLPSKFKLKDHMNLHTGSRPYCCAECGKRFCQIDSYRVHLRTHAQVKVDRLVCRVCRTAFASPAHLKDHLSRTHFEKEFYECDLCKRVFTSLDQCKYHVQLHKCMAKVVCDKCGRKFSSPKYLTRHRMTFHRNFKCNDCLQTFTKKNALLKHSFSHLGLLPYTCVRCNCHFRLARLYLQHKCEPERIHCVACLREFLSQEDFQQHKKDTGCWGNQEPKGDQIRCLECGQRFETPEELKQHAGAHQRVLKCAECGKGFRSALLLMSHMGGHAGNTPCLCQSCGLGFPHQQNYNSHLKTCGQTPVSASKKSQASRSSSFESKSVNKRPDSANATSTVPVPPAVSDSSAAPVKDGVSPGPEPGDVAAGSASSDGLWKLTLNKQPPPGVKLVLFLPVCQTQPSELTVSDPALQNQPHVALPFGSDEHLGVNTALSSSFNAPLNLSTGIKCDPEWDAPLDLSKKSNLSKSVPVKTEPEEVEISENGDSREFDHKNPRLIATCTEVKR